MHRAMRKSILACAPAVLVACVALPAAAGPLSASAGFDYYAGAANEITRSFVGVVGTQLAGASVAVGAHRFDNSAIGEGAGLIAALALPLGPLSHMRAQVSTYAGAEDYQAWRLRVGPEIQTPVGAHVGLYYTRFADETASSNGASADVTLPAAGPVTPRIAASWMSAEGRSAIQGSAGLGIRPLHGLELIAEAGIAQSAAAGAGSFPSTQSRLSRLLGGSEQEAPSQDVTDAFEATGLLGFRVMFP